MEPAQPADRVPADPTPADRRPPTTPAGVPVPADAAGPETPAPPGTPVGEPALVDTADAVPVPPGEPARGEPDGASAAPPADGAAGTALPVGAAETGELPAPPARVEAGRSERSPKDMAISLLVLLVPIALLLAFYRGFLGGDQPTTVDPTAAVDSARAANVFPVSQPAGLGDDWRTVNATFQTAENGATLRIGYLTPEGRGAQLVQSNVPPERLLPVELTAQGQPQGQVELDGRTWQRYTARGNEQALVLLEPGRTMLVVGDAGDNELRRLASAVR